MATTWKSLETNSSPGEPSDENATHCHLDYSRLEPNLLDINQLTYTWTPDPQKS